MTSQASQASHFAWFFYQKYFILSLLKTLFATREQVADFGLAKLALELDLHTHVSTRVMGTFG